MKRAVLSLCLSVVPLATTPDLLACRCIPPPPPLEEIEKVDMVFRGQLLSLDVEETGQVGNFSVLAVWKGPVLPNLEVHTGVGGADCGFFFEVGQTYIVYAFGTPDDLNTHTCTRTTLDDSEEAKALGVPLWEASEALVFRRGDPDEDGQLTITDAVQVLLFLFQGLFPPWCPDGVDTNDDGQVDIADPVYHLNHLFSGGPAPPDPFTECGGDPTPDTLHCERYTPCGA